MGQLILLDLMYLDYFLERIRLHYSARQVAMACQAIRFTMRL